MSTAALKEQYRKLALDAHAVVTDKSMTPAEIAEKYEPMEADLKALSEEIAASEKVEAAAKSLGAILSDTAPAETEEKPAETTAETVVKSLGEQFTEAAGYKSFVDNLKAGGSSLSSGPIELKATLTESGLGSANVIAPTRQPGVLPILFERLTVADLFASGTTNSNLVRYVQESTATNAASTVAEGGPKPEATLNFTAVDEPVRKIAVVLKVTDEMLEDFDQMASWVNGRLSLFVQLTEEAELLRGNGIAPDLNGILNRSLTAAQAKSSDSIADAVHKEITKIRVASFLDPTGLVFHPNDWEAALLEKDTQNRYYGPSPFQQQGAPTYWGLPVVSTTAMTENTVLIGAFKTAAQVFRRTGVTVDMTNSNEDDFKKNLVAVRAEERLALAVYRPSAFGTVTGV